MISRKDIVKKMDASRRFSSAALIVEDEAGKALIVKASYKSYWTFPGGIVDPGETPKEAAVRETFEETGISVDIADLDFVAVINRKGTEDTYQFIFRTKLPRAGTETVSLQTNEIIDKAFVSKAEVKAAKRSYGRVIQNWVEEKTGYIEQRFDDKSG